MSETTSAVEQRVQARIAAARARIAQRAADRAAFARRRAYGLRARHTAKLRNLDASERRRDAEA